MRVVVLVGVAVLLILVGCTRAQELLCSQRAREACRLLLCQECELIDGEPQCVGASSGNACISPCLEQDPLTPIFAPPSSVLASRPCVYYDAFVTPHEEVLTPTCVNVASEAQCESLAGIFEYTLGTPGFQCNPYTLFSSVVAPGSCCPQETISALDPANNVRLCISNDTSYAGPEIQVDIRVCLPPATIPPTCGIRQATVKPGQGLVFPDPPAPTATCTATCTESCTPINSTHCSADCTPQCTALCSTVPETSCVPSCMAQCSASCDPISTSQCTPLPCSATCTATATAQYEWSFCPDCQPNNNNCSAFNTPIAPQSVGAPLLGTCFSGVCQGTLDTTIVGSNTQGNQCEPGYCVPKFVEETFEIDNPASYPTETCNPLCPGFPACTSPCPGWPNADDALLSILEPLVDPVGLAEGERCRSLDACIPSAVCTNQQCLPTATKDPVCERLTCRECDSLSGTCFGPPSAAGTPCRLGCLQNSLGTCDGMGNCVGNDIGQSLCGTQLEPIIPEDPIHTPCYDIVCLPVVVSYRTETEPSRVFAISFNGVPVIPPFTTQQDINAAVDVLFQQIVVDPFTCRLDTTLVPCSDNDLCTQQDTCTEEFLCVPQTETRTSCAVTQCATCNPATGLCQGIVADSEVCFNPCSDPNNPLGFCNTNTGNCAPVDNSFNPCPILPIDAPCNVPRCNADFVGFGNPPQPQFPIPLNTIPEDEPGLVAQILQAFSLQCSIVPRIDNITCTSINRDSNKCILEEQCRSGQCTATQLVDCSDAFVDNVCVDNSLTECELETGSCMPGALPPGSSCNTGDSCFFAEACIFDGVNEPTCIGQPSIDCAQRALDNPCIASSFCDGSGTDPACIDQLERDGFPCSVPSPGLCAPIGNCVQGVCMSLGTECPVSTNPCQINTCDPFTGICAPMDRLDNTPCNDGLSCTTGDICLSGQCDGTQRVCTPSECQISLGCSEPSGLCAFNNRPDGTPCSVGVCISGTCSLQCDPPCQGGGVCIGVDPTVCRCPRGREGQFCEEIVDTSTSILMETGTNILNTATSLIIFLIVTNIIIGVTVAFFCYYTVQTPEISAILYAKKTN